MTGGYVYNGNSIQPLRNAYVYGDFVSGRIWALWLDNEKTAHNTLLLESSLRISSFGLDAQGEILIVDYRGGLHRLEKAN